MIHKAVFIDRDGVINSDEGHYYIYRVEDFQLNPDLPKALKMLADNGFMLIVITNQGGVAKGEYTLADVNKVHAYLRTLLIKEAVELDAIYVCPHHHSVAPCECRKPSPYMILQGINEFDIDPKRSYMIGDSTRDIEAGEAAGLKQCFKVPKNSSILEVCKLIVEMDGATR